MIGRFSTQTLAKFAALYAGLAYGIYWIPLRALVMMTFGQIVLEYEHGGAEPVTFLGRVRRILGGG